MSNWAVLCPGPSLPKYKNYEHDKGCSIAVNGAIYQVNCDYWAMIDHEVLLSVAAKMDLNFLALATTLWVPEKWQGRADKGIIPPIFRAFKRLTFKDLPNEMKIGHGWRWNEKTMFAAMALAIMNGARSIKVYGADMAGSGYFTDGLENKKQVHTPKRWEDEKILFGQVQRICDCYGIKVERILA